MQRGQLDLEEYTARYSHNRRNKQRGAARYRGVYCKIQSYTEEYTAGYRKIYRKNSAGSR